MTSRIPILSLLLALLFPALASAQSDLREAGNEIRFRVIDRFPQQNARPLEIPRLPEGSPFYDVIQEVERQNWSTAWNKISADDLQDALNQDPSKRFLAAIIAQRTGRDHEALHFFHSLDDQLPVLNDYRFLYSAQSAFALDQAHDAALLAARVHPESRLYPDALFLLARALNQTGEAPDQTRATELLELYLDRFGSHSNAPQARLLFGDLHRALNNHEAAARSYLRLRDDHPLHASTAQATRHLESLKSALPPALQAQIDQPPTSRTLATFRARYNAHASDRIINELPDFLDSWPSGSPESCEATFLIAHSYTKLRRHNDATPWYDRVLQDCRTSSFEIRALYLGGRGRWNAGDREGAMALFERIWTDFPDHSFADDAMYFTARILRSEDRHQEAEARLKAQVQRYPDGDMAKDAHWLLVRRMFDEAAYDDIKSYVDALANTGEDDLYTRGRLHYFRARALELAGNATEAAQGYVQVARRSPMTYYAFLAIHRLARQQGASDDSPVDICATAGPVCEELLPSSRTKSPLPVPPALQRDQSFERGVQFLTLGLTDLARTEFNELRTRHQSSPDVLWALASLLDSAGAFPLSHSIARSHIPGWMEAYPSESTRARWEIAYPIPFHDTVTRFAERRGLNPALIFAIMREESGFNPRVESWANARGLLQLIEDTARRTASNDGLTTFSFDQLFDPTINIRLGSAFMQSLASQADGHPALIMAGYNAGFAAVSQWLASADGLPLDLFIEDIPFGQTRNYTKRVLMSYWIYSYLYGQDRVPPIRFDL